MAPLPTTLSLKSRFVGACFWSLSDAGRRVKILCAVPRRASSAGANPARQLSFQPAAVGAAMEATKSSKPSTQRVAFGDSASRQAVTCVNAEQASKDQEAGADLAVFQGRPPSWGS